MISDVSFRMLQLSAGGYCCSQIILILALEAQGRSNTDLVRAASGLCHGMGSANGPCGALLGGFCLLALHGGRGEDVEEEDPGLALMIEELAEWFQESFGSRHGGITCSAILGEDATRRPDMSRCGNLVQETYIATMRILADHGYDTTSA